MLLSEQVTLALIVSISNIVLALFTLARTVAISRANAARGESEIRRLKTQEEIDREKREDEQKQRTLDVLVEMNRTTAKQVEQNGELIKQHGDLIIVLNQMRSTADERNRIQAKATDELVDQGNTLDTMEAQMIVQTKDLKEHREEIKPVLSVAKEIPERLANVKAEINSLREGLPEQVKSELQPAFEKLELIEKSVASVEKDVRALIEEVRAMHVDFAAAIKAALAVPEKDITRAATPAKLD